MTRVPRISSSGEWDILRLQIQTQDQLLLEYDEKLPWKNINNNGHICALENTRRKQFS